VEQREDYMEEMAELIREDLIEAAANLEIKVVVSSADVRLHNYIAVLESPINIASAEFAIFFPSFDIFVTAIAHQTLDNNGKRVSNAVLTAKLVSGPDEMYFSRASTLPDQHLLIDAVLRIQIATLLSEILVGLMPE